MLPSTQLFLHIMQRIHYFTFLRKCTEGVRRRLMLPLTPLFLHIMQRFHYLTFLGIFLTHFIRKFSCASRVKEP